MSMVREIGRDALLKCIRESGEGGISKKDILEKTGFKGDFNYNIKLLLKENDELQKIGSKGVKNIYKWSPKKAIYSEFKNPEGYSDRTAGKAIANVMKKSGKYPMRQRFGEVWSNNSGLTDDQEGVLIIAGFDGTCVCAGVYPQKKSFMKSGATYSWSDDRGSHYISTIHLVNINERKLERKLFEMSDEKKAEVKEAVRCVFSIEPEIKTEILTVDREVKVPVEVIKEVEVPVEVVKEIRTDEKDIELMLLKQKVEIYEKLIFGGCSISQKLQSL